MTPVTRRTFVGSGIAVVAAMLAGCTSTTGTTSSSSPAESSGAASSSSSSSVVAAGSELRFATGGQSGVYYDFGQQLAQHAADMAGLSITALASNGSQANVQDVEDGLAELALCQSDVMVQAFDGTGLFEGIPFESFSVVAALYDEQVQIVTRNDEIKTVADLAGKRVSIGAPNSGVNLNASEVLAAYGVAETDFTPTYEGFGDSASSLKDGRIDAAFIVAGAPVKAVTDLFASGKAHLVPLDDRHIAELAASSPSYAASAIESGTYPGQAKAVATVAVQAVVIAADSVPDDDVYAFVKDVFESAADPETASAHEKYGSLSVEKGASVSSVPYHPGAARFFAEAGFTVEAKRVSEQ